LRDHAFTPNDPDQLDRVWLAIDSTWRLAAMVTAGRGPIPASLLAMPLAADVEQILLRLPIIGRGLLAMQMPDPTSFLKLSERGLFVYDWTDIHRTRVEYKQAYELVCSPTVRLDREGLPAELDDLAFDVAAIFGSPFIKVG
jgi:hypothetical protein